MSIVGNDDLVPPIITAVAWSVLGIERGMMLFGQSSTNQDVAVGASLVACLLAAISGLFAYLTSRDKLRFDVKTVTMENEIVRLQESQRQCHNERVEDKKLIDALTAENKSQQDQLNENRRLIDALRAQVDKMPGSKHD